MALDLDPLILHVFQDADDLVQDLFPFLADLRAARREDDLVDHGHGQTVLHLRDLDLAFLDLFLQLLLQILVGLGRLFELLGLFRLLGQFVDLCLKIALCPS